MHMEQNKVLRVMCRESCLHLCLRWLEVGAMELTSLCQIVGNAEACAR